MTVTTAASKRLLSGLEFKINCMRLQPATNFGPEVPWRHFTLGRLHDDVIYAQLNAGDSGYTLREKSPSSFAK
jgi:hypothetical protein